MPRHQTAALIEAIRKLGGCDEEFLTRSHIEYRYGSVPINFLPAMPDGRWRASDVEQWFDAKLRELQAGLRELQNTPLG
jgi:hypothetical protein